MREKHKTLECSIRIEYNLNVDVLESWVLKKSKHMICPDGNSARYSYLLIPAPRGIVVLKMILAFSSVDLSDSCPKGNLDK